MVALTRDMSDVVAGFRITRFSRFIELPGLHIAWSARLLFSDDAEQPSTRCAVSTRAIAHERCLVGDLTFALWGVSGLSVVSRMA